jgi:hypothetical protein
LQASGGKIFATITDEYFFGNVLKRLSIVIEMKSSRAFQANYSRTVIGGIFHLPRPWVPYTHEQNCGKRGKEVS